MKGFAPGLVIAASVAGVFVLRLDFFHQEIIQESTDERDNGKLDETFKIGIDRRDQDIGSELELKCHRKPSPEHKLDFRAGGWIAPSPYPNVKRSGKAGKYTNDRSGFQHELQHIDRFDKTSFQKTDIHDGECFQTNLRDGK